MDTTTALVIVIPDQFHDKINEVRSKSDRAYPRWMPHLTLLFPFVEVEQFPEIYEKLQNKLKNFGGFQLNFNKIDYFKQGRNVTMHIKPSNDMKLQELFKAIRDTFPDIQTKHDEFHPHLTIGQFKNSELQQKTQELNEWLGNGFSVYIDCVCLLNRSKIDNNIPFSINKKIML